MLFRTSAFKKPTKLWASLVLALTLLSGAPSAFAGDGETKLLVSVGTQTEPIRLPATESSLNGCCNPWPRTAAKLIRCTRSSRVRIDGFNRSVCGILMTIGCGGLGYVPECAVDACGCVLGDPDGQQRCYEWCRVVSCPCCCPCMTVMDCLESIDEGPAPPQPILAQPALLGEPAHQVME